MKKSLIATLPVATFVAGMAVVPSVFAAGGSYTDWATLKSCLQNTGGEAVTCTLGGDIEADSGVTLGNNVTLDLANHKITVTAVQNGSIWARNGNSSIITGQGGSIVRTTTDPEHSAPIIAVEGSATPTTLEIQKGVTISGVQPMVIYPTDSDNTAANNQSKITIAGDLVNNVKKNDNTENSAIEINGTIQGGPVINITGKLTGMQAGIYQAGNATTTLNGATVTGTSGSGIAIKAGTLNLANTAIIAQGNKVESKPLPGGFLATGAGIQVEANSGYQGNIDINIQNGTSITSQKGDAIEAYGNADDKIEAVTITGDDVTLDAPNGSVLAVANEETINFPELTVNGEKVSIAELATLTEFSTVPTPVAPEENPENPNTADPMALYITIAAVALTGLGATALIASKTRR